MEKNYNEVEKVLILDDAVAEGKKLCAVECSEESINAMVDEYFSNMAGKKIHIDISDEDVKHEIAYRHIEEYFDTKDSTDGKKITITRIENEKDADKIIDKIESDKQSVLIEAIAAKIATANCIEHTEDDRLKAEFRRCVEDGKICAIMLRMMNAVFNFDQLSNTTFETLQRDLLIPKDIAEEMIEIMNATAIDQVAIMIDEFENKRAKRKIS